MNRKCNLLVHDCTFCHLTKNGEGVSCDELTKHSQKLTDTNIFVKRLNSPNISPNIFLLNSKMNLERRGY